MMKYLHCFSIERASLTADEFGELCNLKPEGEKPRRFHIQVLCKEPLGDEVVHSVIRTARRHGLTRGYHSSRSTYGYHIARIYEDEELAASRLLLMCRQSEIETVNSPVRPELEPLRIDVSHLKTDVSVGRIFPNRIIVGQRVRVMLLDAGLVGLEFREVELCGQVIRANALWELRSSLVLPKMANAPQFVHPGVVEVEPFQGDYNRIVMIDEPPFESGEIHYKSEDLIQVGPFDIAHTFEKYLEPHRALVVSQRFYQLFRANEIALNVLPVRVDPV